MYIKTVFGYSTRLDASLGLLSWPGSLTTPAIKKLSSHKIFTDTNAQAIQIRPRNISVVS
jgi:hypothetical protein